MNKNETKLYALLRAINRVEKIQCHLFCLNWIGDCICNARLKRYINELNEVRTLIQYEWLENVEI